MHFVVIDMDKERSKPQQELVEKYYGGYIPHVVVLDQNGKALYSLAGEAEELSISTILDKALQ